MDVRDEVAELISGETVLVLVRVQSLRPVVCGASASKPEGVSLKFQSACAGVEARNALGVALRPGL